MDHLNLESYSGSCARPIIEEALAAFEKGAYRSVVISTWVALVHDVIGKIKTLAVIGDPNIRETACKMRNEISSFAGVMDLHKKSMEFEREVLEKYAVRLNLISSTAAIKLNRIKATRNLCAHPTMFNIDKLYTISRGEAEELLKLAHDHLLSQPPIQFSNSYQQLDKYLSDAQFPSRETNARPLFAAAIEKLDRSEGHYFLAECIRLFLEEPSLRPRCALACSELRTWDVTLFAARDIECIWERINDRIVEKDLSSWFLLASEVEFDTPLLMGHWLDDFATRNPHDLNVVKFYLTEQGRRRDPDFITKILSSIGFTDFAVLSQRLAPKKEFLECAIRFLGSSGDWSDNNTRIEHVRSHAPAGSSVDLRLFMSCVKDNDQVCYDVENGVNTDALQNVFRLFPQAVQTQLQDDWQAFLEGASEWSRVRPRRFKKARRT